MDNRTNILSCALQLFAARGYDAVSVTEVVDAAGVTQPALYHYFGSKRGLLDAPLAEPFTELYQVIEEAATYRGDLPLTLNWMATAYFRYAKDNPLFYRMQLSIRCRSATSKWPLPGSQGTRRS
jgi:TetR/AcrR family transcriptional regulator